MDEERLTCPICLLEFASPIMLSCQHIFCYRCIKKYADCSSLPECPTCRNPFTLSDIRRNLFLEQCLSDKNKGQKTSNPRPPGFPRDFNVQTSGSSNPNPGGSGGTTTHQTTDEIPSWGVGLLAALGGVVLGGILGGAIGARRKK